MELKEAIDYVRQSIYDMDNNYISFTTSDKEKHKILLDVLNNDNNEVNTWEQLAGISNLRSSKLSYLQNPIDKLECDYTSYSKIMFDQGISEWFGFFGMSEDSNNGYTFAILRNPTIGYYSNSMIDYDELIKSTLFYIIGYIIIDNIKYPFSTDKKFLTCSCKYIKDEMGNLSIKLYKYDNNDTGILLSDFLFTSSNFLNNMNISITYKKDNNIINISTVNQISPYKQGDKYACAPCISGVGTSYFSSPLATGTMTTNDISIKIKSWFDHQWGTLSPDLRSPFGRIQLMLLDYFKKPPFSTWIWMGIQYVNKNKEIQYNIAITGIDRNNVKIDSVFKTSFVTKMYRTDINKKIKYKLTGNITILGIYNKYPNKLLIEISDGNIFILESIINDGTVLLSNGSENMEVPCNLFMKPDTGSETKVRCGQGFIEVNRLNNENNDIDYLASIAKIPTDKISKFYKKKPTFYEVLPSIIVLLLLIILLICILYIIIKVLSLLRYIFN